MIFEGFKVEHFHEKLKQQILMVDAIISTTSIPTKLLQTVSTIECLLAALIS